MNEKLENRLFNYKFDSACGHLEGEDDETREVVEALAAAFGNPGWFDGHMSSIINAACKGIGANFDDE